MQVKKWGRRLAVAAAILLILIVAAGGGLYWWISRIGYPEVKGSVQTGVEEEVEIIRDDYGVPHIKASSQADLFYAQGYAQAQDRMWQMDISRRAVSGRLSEVLGLQMLSNDRFALTVGFRRAAEKSMEAISPEARDMLKSYSRGVNAYLEDNCGNLAPEFRLTGYKPEPWEPVDSLAVSKYMAWYLGGNMKTELFLSALKAEVGEEKASELFPYYPEDGDTIVEQEKLNEISFTDQDVEKLAGLSRLAEPGGPDGYVSGMGSNCWVVSGDHTESGRALLANDMHLGMELPSIWYTQQLMLDDEFSLYGAMFPGIPGVIAGFNEHIAWGLTNVGPDVQDLYQVRFDEDEPYRYEYEGGYKEAEVLEKEIPVKGEDKPREMEVVITHHGPVVSDVVGLSRGRALSLRWTALDPTREADALLGLAYARDWEDFSQALENFKAPAQNFVYADREGNIGYRANGLFPIRGKGEGLLPSPGWKDDYEWEGYVPWEEIPEVYNPPEGKIVTANQRVVDEDYPYFISHEWAPPYRAEGIKRGLQERKDLTLQDMKDIQGSFYNTQAEKLLPVFIRALEGGDLDETGETSLEILKEWKEQPVDKPGLAAPLIYHRLYLQIIEDIFKEELGSIYYDRLLSYRSLTNVMDRKLTTGESSWFRVEGVSGEEARDEIIVASFERVTGELKQKHGSDPRSWKWGEVHTITFEHDMAPELGMPGGFLNRGPYPVGGSGVTPANMSFPFSNPYRVTHSAPWRFVVDIEERKGQDVLAIGNSGHPFSPHYDDQLQKWLNRELKPVPVEAEEIEDMENRLLLHP